MAIVKTCPIRNSANCRTDCAWYVEGSCAITFIAIAQFTQAFGPDKPMGVTND
jgi:hypothetical protein